MEPEVIIENISPDESPVKIERVSILEYSYKTTRDSRKSGVTYDFDTKFKFLPGINIAHGLAKIEVLVLLEMIPGPEDQDLKTSATMTLDFIFRFDNAVFNLKEANSTNPSIEEKSFFTKLTNISMGVIRGVLFEKTRSTIFNRALLPILTDAQIERMLFDSNEAFK